MNATSCSIISQTKRFAMLGVILAGVLASIVIAQAKETVPWKGKSTGQLIPTALGIAVAEAGFATHVGNFTETGTPTYIDPEDPSEGVITLIEITAANGDKLFGYLAGSSGALPVIEVEIVIFDGTGRFDGATGGYMATLTIDPATFAFTATSTGTISTVGSNKK